MTSAEYRSALDSLPYGKRLPGAIYLIDPGPQVEAIPSLLRITVAELRKRLEISDAFNLLKFHTATPKVSFLAYPGFEKDPHPALQESIIVDLITGKIRRDDYRGRANLPILHRKETFLPSDHPWFAKFARLTRAEEAAGLLADGSRIGFQLNWQRIVAEKGFGFKGHQLVAINARNKYLATLEPAEYVAGFVRYQKYSRADVFRILGCLENPVAQNVGGYLLDPNCQWCPIFVNYKKDEGIAATIQYEDAFIDPTKMRWFTKSRRSLTSPDVKFFADPNGHGRIPLFVKKNGDEGMEFYYLGDTSPEISSIAQTTMADGNGGNVSVVHMDLSLDRPVEESLYCHLVS